MTQAGPGDPWGNDVEQKPATAMSAVPLYKRVFQEIRTLLGVEQKQRLWSDARLQVRMVPDEGKHFASKWWFNVLVVLCILADSVLVGVESDYSSGNSFEERFQFWLCDVAFGILFLTEMAVRQHQQGWEYFADPWNMFDFICVSLGCTAAVQPTLAASSNTSHEDMMNLRLMKALKGFRVLRLLRVVRHIDGLKVVEGLWLLVSGMLASMRTLFWVGIFCLIMIYSFGCTIVVAADDPLLRDMWADHDLYVGSIFRGCLSIWQICTFDRWIDIARPVIEFSPFAGVILFLAILVVTFGVLNVMLSVMVESIGTILQLNKMRSQMKLEETEKRLLSRMERDFEMRDYQGNGWLGYKDFRDLLQDENFGYKLRLLGFEFQEAHQLFYLMDVDGVGHVSWDEFCRGLRKLKGSAQAQDLVKVINFAMQNRRKAMKYVDRVRRLCEQADSMQARLDEVGKGIVKQLDWTGEAERHNTEIICQSKMRYRAVRRLWYDMQVSFPAHKR